MLFRSKTAICMLSQHFVSSVRPNQVFYRTTEPNRTGIKLPNRTVPNCTEPNLYRTMHYRNSIFWSVFHGRLANISDNICSSWSFLVKKCPNSTFSENGLKIFFINYQTPDLTKPTNYENASLLIWMVSFIFIFKSQTSGFHIICILSSLSD